MKNCLWRKEAQADEERNKEAMGAPKRQVRTVIWQTVKKQKWLSLGIVLAVVGAVVTALIPPLILARIVDTITGGNKAASLVILVLYFAMLALTGFMESAREGLLTVFGQKDYPCSSKQSYGKIRKPYL